MEIEIKHKTTGNVLFSHECEDNSILKTLKDAIKSGADIRGTDIRDTLCTLNIRTLYEQLKK